MDQASTSFNRHLLLTLTDRNADLLIDLLLDRLVIVVSHLIVLSSFHVRQLAFLRDRLDICTAAVVFISAIVCSFALLLLDICWGFWEQ